MDINKGVLFINVQKLNKKQKTNMKIVCMILLAVTTSWLVCNLAEAKSIHTEEDDPVESLPEKTVDVDNLTDSGMQTMLKFLENVPRQYYLPWPVVIGPTWPGSWPIGLPNLYRKWWYFIWLGWMPPTDWLYPPGFYPPPLNWYPPVGFIPPPGWYPPDGWTAPVTVTIPTTVVGR